jgi:hypothetical protein
LWRRRKQLLWENSPRQESGGNPTTYLLALKYMDSMKEMVSGKDNKVVYVPYEATALLGSFGSIKEFFEPLISKM